MNMIFINAQLKTQLKQNLTRIKKSIILKLILKFLGLKFKIQNTCYEICPCMIIKNADTQKFNLLNEQLQQQMGSGCTKPKDVKTTAEQYTKAMFQFKKVIGKGGFGRVWKVVQKKTRKTYAMKVMDKAKIITKKSVNSVLNQREILCKLQHSFIVNMHCAFQDRENLYLLIDYLEGGDLRYYINRNYSFGQEQIKFIIRCIMEGLKYLHDNNIIHRDMKPQNIIFDKNGYCRITDLGVARYWKSENSHETSGTPGYMAPEVLLRQNHSFCVDYFAVGIIAYELALGKRPYIGRQRKQIRDQMLARQAKIPASYKGLSQQGIDFINKMIQRHAKKRLGYNGIQEILGHPWLKMRPRQLIDFCQLKYPSPIVPMQISLHHSLNQVTEPDEVWRQNILLLKRPQTQNLFVDYDFMPNNHSSRKQPIKRRQSLPEYDSYATNSYDYEKAASLYNSSTQAPFQDTISFMSTRRTKSHRNN